MKATLLPSSRIAERRDAVITRRQKVKVVSSERGKKLQASLAWQQFRRNADEVGTCMYGCGHVTYILV